MAIEYQSYSEFEKWLADKLGEARIPISGMIELTPRCNLRCAHCYMGALRDDRDQMDTAFICSLLAQIAAAGCFAISFTGGEPLLRRDYRQIHRTAHQLGFWINLLTNGVLVDASLISFLQQYPPRAVEVTLYGGNEDSYAALTGNGNAFYRVTHNIDAMLQAGLPVILKSVLLKPVLASMDEMNAFATERGLEILFDAGVTPDLLQDFSPTDLRLAPGCAVDIELDSPKKTALLKAYHDRMGQRDAAPGFTCGAGHRGFHVDYRGNLLPCLMLREPAFDLIQQYTFASAFEAMGRASRPQFPESSRCSRCDLQHLCGFCPGTVACGEVPPGSEDSFYCKVAKSRLKKLQ
ncbi:MAG: radical SAM protein [Deltaproteobacteria bacterium]|nr:radical SAM protein [Deltaproteobacteria bacterium]